MLVQITVSIFEVLSESYMIVHHDHISLFQCDLMFVFTSSFKIRHTVYSEIFLNVATAYFA